MASEGINQGATDNSPLAHEEALRQLSSAREENERLRAKLGKAEHASTSIDGLDVYLLRVDANGYIQYINSAFCNYLQVERSGVEGQQLQVLERFLDKRILDIISNPSGDKVVQIGDELHNTTLEIKLSWKNGVLDAVFHDITGDTLFRNYVLKYVPSALRNIPEEDLYTFRYPDRRFMSVSFTDLRGFTALTETMGPEEVRSTLNNYFEEVITAIEDNCGTVDKIIGDEVMAFYGAPRYFRDHALRAVKTACDQQHRVKQLQKSFLELGKQLPDCGIGIHTGDMIIGNIGSSTRQDYTVLGGTVNLASHLCSAARGGEILISEVTLREALSSIPRHWEALHTKWDDDEGEFFKGGKVEGVYLLEGDRQNKAILLGPNVTQNPENAEFCFRYLYALKIKGISDLVPIISVTSPKDDTSLELDPNQVVQISSERIFGKFRLIEMIGRGGMGEIWKARDSFGNEVAIKTLIAGESASENQIKRFKREAKTMAKLVHRNICRVLEVGEVDRISYISMEYVEGVDLADLLIYNTAILPQFDAYKSKPVDLGTLAQEVKANRDGQSPAYELDEKGEVRFRVLPEKQIIDIILKMCSGLQYAHVHGILHRDIKPANVMIRSDGEPIITDFGLAKVQGDHDDVSLSLTGQLVGTLEYMAPEQASDSHVVSEAVDVYSVGAVFYLMVTGHKHFTTTGNLLNDIKRLQEHEPVRPRLLNKNIDADLETIILKALSPDPNHRYRNFLSLRSDIERYKNGEVISAKEQSLIDVFSKVIKRNKSVTLAVAIFVMFLIAASTFYIVDVNKRNIQLSKVISQMEQANRERERAERDKESSSLLVKEKEKEAREKDRIAREAEKNAEVQSKENKAIKDSVVRDFLSMAGDSDKIGRLHEAIEYSRKAVEKFPENAEAWWQHGRYLEKANRLDEAQQSYSKASGLIPSEARYKDSLKAVSETIQYTRTFIGRYEKAVASEATLPQVEHIRAGDIYFDRGRLDDAVKAYRLANSGTNPFSSEVRLKQFFAECRDLYPKMELRKRITVVGGRVSEINFSFDNIQALPSLDKMELGKLNLSGSGISSLNGIIGANIKILDLSKTTIADASPLSKCTIEELVMDGMVVPDLSAIRNSTIKVLRLRNANIPDYGMFATWNLGLLDLSENKLNDVAKLGAIRVQELNLSGNPIHSLNFAPGVRVSILNVSNTKLDVIDSLAGMPLQSLNISRTKIDDLAPLSYNVIARLNISETEIASLNPVRKMPLVELDIRKTAVTDLSPLAACPLETFQFDPEKITSGIDVLRYKNTIKQIGKDQLMPPAQFWRAYDAGEFGKGR